MPSKEFALHAPLTIPNLKIRSDISDIKIFFLHFFLLSITSFSNELAMNLFHHLIYSWPNCLTVPIQKNKVNNRNYYPNNPIFFIRSTSSSLSTSFSKNLLRTVPSKTLTNAFYNFYNIFLYYSKRLNSFHQRVLILRLSLLILINLHLINSNCSFGHSLSK